MMKILWTLLLLFISSAGAQFCSPPTGWSCKALPGSNGLEFSHRNLTVIYGHGPNLVVIVRCEGARDMDLPDALLSNFTFPQNVTYFYFRQCPLPFNNTFASILSDRTVLTLRIDPPQDLKDGLTPEAFRGLNSATYLNFQQCGVTSLNKTIFRFAPNVRTLNLKDNLLTQLDPDTFEGAPLLNMLELGNNNLTKLTEKMTGLTNVRSLYLYRNGIYKVSREFFSSLPALTTLDFQANSLKEVSADLLADVPDLTTLNLYTNQLLSIPEGFLDNQSRLTEISLADNRNLSTLPANLLHRAHSLLKFAADRCDLSALSPAFFDSPALSNLSQLSLSRNKLSTLYQRAFGYLSNLTSFNLNFNQLTEIEQNTFSGLKKLEELSMNNNSVRSIHPAAFQELTKLKTIRLNGNRLTFIEEKVFEMAISLENLYLEDNRLTTPDSSNVPFNLPNSIANVWLSNNSLAVLPSNWILEKTLLVHMDLRYNEMSYFDAEECQPTSGLVIDLSYNNISRTKFDMLFMESLADFNSALKQGTSRPTVILDHNPIICDCYADDLLEYYANQADRHYSFVVQMDHLQCASPSIFYNQLLINIPIADLFCEEEIDCPYPCRCVKHALGDVIEVDCRGLNLSLVPTTAPHKVSILLLDNNRLTDLDDISRSVWTNLTKLTADFNRISRIGAELPKYLKELRLKGNRLTHLNRSTVEYFNSSTHLRQLYLESNPWNCDDCQNQRLRDFLNANLERVGNASAILCAGSTKILVQEPICPPEPTLTKEVLIATVFICLLTAVALAGAAISYYRYNREIKVWLYAHRMCLWLVKEKELDKNKRFDAFISFSQEDAEFVASHLMPGLEEEEPFYKLCVHQRDWLAGEWIPDQIIRSVEDSRRTIVVLSKNFIKSVWGRLEFKAAHHQALQDRTNRIIILVYGDLPPSAEMDPDLKMYVKFNTYLKWGDIWFWQKLRYAMPHCPIRTSVPPLSFRSLRSPSARPPSDPNNMVNRLAGLK